MDKTQRKKWKFEREDKRENQKKKNWKKRRIFKTGLSKEQNFKTSKIAGKLALLGLFTKHKHKNTEEKHETTKKQKTDQKNTFFAFWQTTPYFGNFFFVQVTLFYVCKLCLLKTL